MNKQPEITVNVNMEITRETAERAVKILNWYLEDHPEVKPKVHNVVCAERMDYTKIIIQGG